MLLKRQFGRLYYRIGEQRKKSLGFASPEYIFSDKIHQLINENKIQNIGNEQKYDVEKF